MALEITPLLRDDAAITLTALTGGPIPPLPPIVAIHRRPRYSTGNDLSFRQGRGSQISGSIMDRLRASTAHFSNPVNVVGRTKGNASGFQHTGKLRLFACFGTEETSRPGASPGRSS
jgi:hypothetical protein